MAASAAGSDLIVFPEYGLTGFSSYPKSAWISGGYTEIIPDVAGPDFVVPCDAGSGFENAASVVTLSCAAKQNRIAIVANLAEQSRCVYLCTCVCVCVCGCVGVCTG